MNQIVDMYYRVYRKPREGTADAAIRSHAQACGFVAYALDMHPDAVAIEVGVDAQQRQMARTPPVPKEGA